MGNFCGISAMNRIVSLGGARNSIDARTEPSKAKSKTQKTTKQQREKRNKAQNLTKTKAEKISSAKAQSSNNNELQNQTVVKVKNQTNMANDPPGPSLSKANNERLVPKQPNKTPNTMEKIQQVQTNNFFLTENAKEKQNHLKNCEGNFLSDFDSSVSNSRQSLFLSSKHLKSEKFKTDWQREEKRLQLEYYKAEQQIKNSQRDELRAKAEAQTWREKLEMLTAEHRKRLFKQAQSLHSRLHSAEKLLTYHEIRAKKLQMKNDKMKELIRSVKDEARNLRIESEKRREDTQKIFDEKFSTVEKQLSKLKQRIGDTSMTNYSDLSPKPSRFNQSIFLQGIDGNQTRKRLNGVSENSCYQRYSRHFQPLEAVKRHKTKDPFLITSPYQKFHTNTCLSSSDNNSPISPKRNDNSDGYHHTSRYHWRTQDRNTSPTYSTNGSRNRPSDKKCGNEKLLKYQNKNMACKPGNLPSRNNFKSASSSRTGMSSKVTSTSNTENLQKQRLLDHGGRTTSKTSDYVETLQSSAGSSMLMRLFERDSPCTSAVSSTVQSQSAR